MRYYKIEIDGIPIFTSYDQSRARSNPAALQVELDIPISTYATPAGSAFVKVWGIPLEIISQSKQLNGKTIKVYGGFQKGLPLANPQQAGLLVQGYIFQAFGNWIGKEMSLDLIVVAGPVPLDLSKKDAPRNIVLLWKKGQLLADVLKTSFATAFPTLTPNININSKLVTQSENEVGVYETLEQFASYLYDVSKSIISDTSYPGVSVSITDKNINVFDGSTPAAQTKIISFNDLVGQPTWIDAPSIQFKCPMRADVQLFDKVKMPPTLVTNSSQAQTSLINQRASFQGEFQISTMRHYGNFRQPNAGSWVTVFNAFPLTTQKA